MSRINRYASKSKLMVVEVLWGDELIKFNLYKELRIDENNMDHELKEHASNYAFLSMLHKKLIIKAKWQERETKKIRAIRHIKLRAIKDTVKEAEIALEKDKVYLKAYKKQLEVEDIKETIEVCVKAHEERKDLLQTLAANLRIQHKQT